MENEENKVETPVEETVAPVEEAVEVPITDEMTPEAIVEESPVEVAPEADVI